MAGKFLSPEASLRLIELAQNPYRPKVILDLKEEIDRKIRLGELREIVEGGADLALAREIVAMKLRLDGLYCAWAEGKIT